MLVTILKRGRDKGRIQFRTPRSLVFDNEGFEGINIEVHNKRLMRRKARRRIRQSQETFGNAGAKKNTINASAFAGTRIFEASRGRRQPIPATTSMLNSSINPTTVQQEVIERQTISDFDVEITGKHDRHLTPRHTFFSDVSEDFFILLTNGRVGSTRSKPVEHNKMQRLATGNSTSGVNQTTITSKLL